MSLDNWRHETGGNASLLPETKRPIISMIKTPEVLTKEDPRYWMSRWRCGQMSGRQLHGWFPVPAPSSSPG
ncbi:unnamed protein product [Nezara viridula]|uniref:Uncharacterized protein n=1 Tax=Nezara viridula TaxID=85310 RepID=A0A9P0HBF7_NEZVI|nr:unnamed protein product [Nezara viridula]